MQAHAIFEGKELYQDLPHRGLFIRHTSHDFHIDRLWQLINKHGLSHAVQWQTSENQTITRVYMQSEWIARWMPDHDTAKIQFSPEYRRSPRATRLHTEILICMLTNPIPTTFPGVDELLLELDVRVNLALAAANTELNFDTDAVHRPTQYWTYDENKGFLQNAGVDLVEALEYTTQPALSGQRFSFSCYRATEYVILLGIAKTLKRRRPALYTNLMLQWQAEPLQSGRFHEHFLIETGSLENPYPMCFYTPGDRVWFKNPHLKSSDVAGYEGSWVVYLGQGQFTNFWDRQNPFDLKGKCVEIYHWRNGLTSNEQGEPAIDEAIVKREVAKTLSAPKNRDEIIAQMMRYRDPAGVYLDGGCIDASREAPTARPDLRGGW